MTSAASTVWVAQKLQAFVTHRAAVTTEVLWLIVRGQRNGQGPHHLESMLREVGEAYELGAAVRVLKNFGRAESGADGYVDGRGLNLKFTDLQADVGLDQMRTRPCRETERTGPEGTRSAARRHYGTPRQQGTRRTHRRA